MIIESFLCGLWALFSLIPFKNIINIPWQIGQRHGGFLGILQRALARASPHIWFERGEAKDRHAVAERLR